MCVCVCVCRLYVYNRVVFCLLQLVGKFKSIYFPFIIYINVGEETSQNNTRKKLQRARAWGKKFLEDDLRFDEIERNLSTTLLFSGSEPLAGRSVNIQFKEGLLLD